MPTTTHAVTALPLKTVPADRSRVLRRLWHACWTTPILRQNLWILHILVTTLAVLSLATIGHGGFRLWIDLRMLGPLQLPVEIVWVLSVLAVPFITRPKHDAEFLSPRAVAWANKLLWPTYFFLAFLLANCVWYISLVINQRADVMFPMPLLMAILLAKWVLLTREWLRRSTALSNNTDATSPHHKTSPSPWTRRCAILLAGTGVMILASAFSLHAFAKPLADHADLAVVLGGQLNEDGSPSVRLRERVEVAINLYQRGQVKHILLSGGFRAGKDGKPDASETAGMKQVCLNAGIPEDDLSEDPVGVNTKATAANTLKFMNERGFRSVVVCSTDFHLYRTTWCFQQVGINAFAVPSAPAQWRCADPRDTLRELVGIVAYRLFPNYRQPKVEAMNLKNPRLVVHKSSRLLELFDGAAAVKTYPCISGRNIGDKSVEGDKRTPTGSFRIVYKNPQSQFHLSLGLDYPNREDADRGLKQGLISQTQYDTILEALKSDLTKTENQKKLWYTPLGGEIFLHGFGEGRDGTAGCVALSNKDIEELYAILPLGTPVEILP